MGSVRTTLNNVPIDPNKTVILGKQGEVNANILAFEVPNSNSMNYRVIFDSTYTTQTLFPIRAGIKSYVSYVIETNLLSVAKSGSFELWSFKDDGTFLSKSDTYSYIVLPSTSKDFTIPSEQAEALVELQDVINNANLQLEDITNGVNEFKATFNGSPKGAYSTLSALQSTFPTGSVGIYIVVSDGKWYYWSGTEWAAGGIYQSTVLADNTVTAQKVSALAYGKPFIMPALVLPNYDTITKTLYFNSDTTYKCMLFYKNTKYDIPVGTSVVDGNATSAVQLLFDTTNNTFSFVGHTVVPTETQIRVAVYKRYAKFYQWDFPCGLTIDGVPMESQNSGIPKYFSDEVKDTVGKVQDNTVNKSLVLSVVTDIHVATNPVYFKDTAVNISEVNKYIASDAIVCLGDLLNEVDANTDKSTTSEVVKLMRQAYVPLFVSRGNHDNVNMTSGRFYALTQRHTEGDARVGRLNNNLYYYVDFAHLGIRMIVLDGAESGVAGGWGFNSTQIDWLGTTALDVPNNWGVLVMCHVPTRASLDYSNAAVPNGEYVEGILNAFDNRASYTYLSKTYDYSSKTGTEVIAYVYGHTHGDAAAIPSGVAFPYISVACAYPSQIASGLLPTGSVAPARAPNAVTQDCWDVLTLRPDERKIYMTRFGAGNDRVINY